MSSINSSTFDFTSSAASSSSASNDEHRQRRIYQQRREERDRGARRKQISADTNPLDENRPTQAASIAPADVGKVGTSISKLLGHQLLIKATAGDQLSTSTLQARVIALYFSASWCNPCKQFTPVLKRLYDDSMKKHGVEVVLISADEDESGFTKYYSSMPWLAIPFESSDINEDLNSQFGIQGIPAVIVLDAKSGRMISEDGQRDVMQEKSNVGKYWLSKTSSSQLRRDVSGLPVGLLPLMSV